MKVFVYFNLHRKVFSVKALEGASKGRVVAHLPQVSLTDAVFKVSEAGRQRVLREQRKNVHAGVVGYLSEIPETDIDTMTAVTYNPYLYSSFVTLADQLPVSTARRVVLQNKKIFAELS
jgi:hypothetical protein